MRLLLPTLLALLTIPAGAALAAEKCDVPVADWQPREALETKLKSDGWEVRSIKTEDGCYEAYAIDAKGEKVEAYFNPKTFERVGGEDDDQG
jgi:hypothetical protein